MAMTVCLLKVPLNYLKALQCHFKLKKVEGPFNKAQPLDNVQDRSSSNTSGSTTSSGRSVFSKISSSNVRVCDISRSLAINLFRNGILPRSEL
ncbi:unnamed protein product [Tenebrio molitor]|nr:unnamed protein product [Tenebrio molitor]